MYSLKRPYRKNAKFICNDQTLAAIRKLTDKNGRYLWQDSVQAGEPGRLLGYEVHTSPYFPVITAGMPAIAFGDYNYYNIGDRGTRSFAELKELFAGNGMVGFVAKADSPRSGQAAQDGDCVMNGGGGDGRFA